MASVVSMSRNSNVVTLSTDYRHGLASAQTVRLLGITSANKAAWAGIFTLTAVSNGGSASIASVAAGTGVYTTSAAHGFAVGQYVTITGCTSAANNGAWVITAVGSTTTFTTGNTSSVLQSSAAGTATTSPWVTYAQTAGNATLTYATEPDAVVYPLVTVRPSALTSNDGWVSTGTTSVITAVNDTSLSTYVRKPASADAYTVKWEFGDPAAAVTGQFIWAVGVRLGVALGSAGSLYVGTGTPRTFDGYYFLNGTIAAPGAAGTATADWESSLTDNVIGSTLLWPLLVSSPWTQTNVNNLQVTLDDVSSSASRATVYEVWGDVLYGTVPYLSAAPSATGTTTTTRPTLSWTHVHADSWAQAAYQVKVFTSAQSDPLNSTSGLVWDSGVRYSTSNSTAIGTDLLNGTTYYVYVRTAVNPWQVFGVATTSATLAWAAWGSGTSTSFTSFTMSLTPPTAPTTAVVWNAASQSYTITSTGSAYTLGTQTFTVERSDDGGATWAAVRGGTGLYADVLVNSGFEDGTATGWTATGTGVTISSSTARFVSGSRSGLITWGTNTAYTAYVGQSVATTPGQQYTFSTSVYVPTGSPNVYLSAYGIVNGGGVSAKDAWTATSITFTAIADSTLLLVGNSQNSTAGQTAYFDNARLDVGASAGTYLKTTVTDYECDRDSTSLRYRTTSIGAVSGNDTSIVGSAATANTNTSDTTWWLKAPLSPALNRGSVQVQAGSLSVTREEAVGVFRPYGRSTAVVVSGVLGGRDGRFEVVATGTTEWAAVEPLILAQQTLLVQDPLGEQRYIRITKRDYEVEGNRSRPVYRVSVDYVEVSAP